MIAFILGNWGDRVDESIVSELSLEVTYLDATRKSKFSWLYYGLLSKALHWMYKFKPTLKISAFASNKRAIQIYNLLKGWKDQPDVIMAHNLGALFPAYSFSKKRNIKLIFDVEDYYPGENIGIDAANEKRRREYIMKQILPRVDVVTYASPLIKVEVEKLLDEKPLSAQLINNSFYQEEFEFVKNAEDQPLRFVWFSQFISFGRGLEPFLEAADKFSNQIEIELIGELDSRFYDEVLEHRKYISTQNPMGQKELHRHLSNSQIGLALELNSADLNRQICLTNKIFAYAQAGLFIFATDTPAQIEFINQHQGLGTLTKQDKEDMEKKIEKLVKMKSDILAKANHRFELAKEYSYDKEQIKLGDLL